MEWSDITKKTIRITKNGTFSTLCKLQYSHSPVNDHSPLYDSLESWRGEKSKRSRPDSDEGEQEYVVDLPNATPLQNTALGADHRPKVKTRQK